MLKIAIAVILGGLVYRLILSISGRSGSGKKRQQPSATARNADAGKIVDADFREIED